MQPINMIMIYYWDKKLKKRLHVLEADISIKKTLILMSLAQRMHFLLDMFQMTTLVLVTVINHYILHLFWDTLYMKNFQRILFIVELFANVKYFFLTFNLHQSIWICDVVSSEFYFD